MPASTVTQTTAAPISEVLLSPEAGKIQPILQGIDEAIRADGCDGSGAYPLKFSSLARCVNYLALGLHEPQRSGRTDKLQPGGLITSLYREFVGAYPQLTMLPNVITDDDLQGLCTFSTRRRGTRKANFYAAMVLFYVNLFEETKIGESELEFIRVATAEGERDFSSRVAELFVSKLKAPASGADAGTYHQAGGKTHEFPIINVGYTYHKTHFDNFKAFFEHFASHVDGNAHFVCYRPRNEYPNHVVKSFLAIQRPQAPKESFGFVHVYRMPSSGSQRRISIGVVLPLANGVCLVGGQRQMTDRKERTVPFSNLKIVIIPWTAITYREQVFGGLAVSADYSGKNLISRMALRCTPINHSDDIELDAKQLTELEADIVADVAREHTIADASDERFRSLLQLQTFLGSGW